jgi:hypothetical protein
MHVIAARRGVEVRAAQIDAEDPYSRGTPSGGRFSQCLFLAREVVRHVITQAKLWTQVSV